MDFLGCGACNSRESCTALCPAAERHANQDFVGMGEITVGLPVITISPTTGYVELFDVPAGPSRFTARERDVLRLLERKMNRNEICEILEISRDNFRKVTHRLKRKWNATPHK